MAIELVEQQESRETQLESQSSLRLVYELRGTADEQAALIYVYNSTPIVYRGLIRQSVRLSPVKGTINEDTDEGTWTVEVDYGPFPTTATARSAEDIESEVSFTTYGHTEHIWVSKQTVGVYVPKGAPAPPDFKGGICVRDDTAEGTDIVMPQLQWHESHIFSDRWIQQNNFIVTLFWMTGKVNKQSFRGFAPGEVLFLGAEGNKRGLDKWRITFHFAASPNLKNFQVGNITVREKRGWDFMWPWFGKEEDNSAKAVVPRTKAIYVERIYDEADFSKLGIGT